LSFCFVFQDESESEKELNSEDERALLAGIAMSKASDGGVFVEEV
jgi:hypothetical protein